MNKGKQKIEFAANILIVVVAVLLIAILVHKYFLTSSDVNAPNSPIIGQNIYISGVDFSKSNKNVLIFLQKGCKFCTQSAEFYKTLIQKTQGKNVIITAVLPQGKDEAEEYLNSLGIANIEAKQARLDTFQVGGTPTIIVANDKGEISDVWVGKLQPDKEIEVINKLIS